MAFGDVAVKISGPKSPPVLNATISDGTAIPKGTLMYWSGTYTALASDATAGRPFAGITNAEKVVSDGSTTIGLETSGVFNIVAGNTITLGSLVQLSGANTVCMLQGSGAGVLTISGGGVVGKALAAGTAGTAFPVAIGYYT